MNFVKKKVDNIRASFRKELRKIRKSNKSGASADDPYKPTLWYFDLLSFTSDQEKPRQSKSSLDKEENIFDEENTTVDTTEVRV